MCQSILKSNSDIFQISTITQFFIHILIFIWAKCGKFHIWGQMSSYYSQSMLKEQWKHWFPASKTRLYGTITFYITHLVQTFSSILYIINLFSTHAYWIYSCCYFMLILIMFLTIMQTIMQISKCYTKKQDYRKRYFLQHTDEHKKYKKGT